MKPLKLDFDDLTVDTFDPEAATLQASLALPALNTADTEDKLCTETACNGGLDGFAC